MKSAVENLDPTRVRLTVEVPFEELKPSLDAAYKRIAAQVTVPGFRRGKVPARIIDQRFGRAAVLEEAVNEALPRFYGDAVRENELVVLGRPEVDVTKFADGDELQFTAEVSVRPSFELPEYRGLEVTVDDATVTDEQVDEQLNGLAERFGTLTGVDRPAADGDFVQIDLTATVDGEEIDSASGVSYQIGSGTMIDGLDEAVTGLSAGDSTTFTTSLAGGEHEGQEAEVGVTVSAVKERELPTLDDDFAQLASEFDTLEELRADLRARLGRMRGYEQAMAARDAVLEKLVGLVELPVPEAVVEDEVRAHLENEGRPEDTEHGAEVADQLRRTLRQQFILDAIVEKEELPVSQEELTEYIVTAAQRSGMTPDQFAQQAVDGGQVPLMVADVRRGKALALVVEAANVVDASGNPVDLSAIFGADEESGEAVEELEVADAEGADGAGETGETAEGEQQPAQA